MLLFLVKRVCFQTSFADLLRKIVAQSPNTIERGNYCTNLVALALLLRTLKTFGTAALSTLTNTLLT